ncbi:MAG: NAD(P)-dependent oxidoreductase [Thermodesulfobacteriota bacterium]
MRVGFIGLGRMGFPMAHNLIKAGHTVVAHNRSRAPVERLVAFGAVPASTPAEAAQSVEILVTCVLTPEQVEEIYLGQGGALEGASAGQIFIDTSTIYPMTSRKIGDAVSARGVHFIDAPISGGPRGAETGTLAVMVGADPVALEKARPVLEVFGKNIFHMGPTGAGCSTKICNQILTGAGHVLVAEAMVLGAKLGIDPQKLFEVLTVSSGQSRALDRSVPEAILPRDFNAVYTVEGMIKDLECAIRTARESGVRLLLPVVAQQIYQEARGLGHGRQHLAAVIQPMEKIAGIEVKKREPAE